MGFALNISFSLHLNSEVKNHLTTGKKMLKWHDIGHYFTILYIKKPKPIATHDNILWDLTVMNKGIFSYEQEESIWTNFTNQE